MDDDEEDKTILPPCAPEWEIYKDKTFKEWQAVLEHDWIDSDSDRGWQLTLEIISAFALAIPHVECGQLDDKSGTRRKAVRSWLMGYACCIPQQCTCAWKC